MKEALLGKGILCGLLDVEPTDQELFDEWYVEHLAERLEVPGFLRARRYEGIVGPDGMHHYLTVYEVRDLDVLSSEPYLYSKYHPTALTDAIGPKIRNGARTAYRVASSAGHGIGGCLVVALLPPLSDGSETDPRDGELLRRLLECRGVATASLCLADSSATQSAKGSEGTFDEMDEMSGRLLLVDIWSELYLEELKQALDHAQAGKGRLGGQVSTYTLLTSADS